MGRARNLGVWTQRIAVAVVVALVVGFAVRVGSTSSQSLEFRDPLIWLVSNATGEVVQADAGSGEVTARVSVGSAADSLQVVQHGADALVLNRTTGEVLRVNGSLLATAERSPITVDEDAQLLGRGDEARVVTESSVTPVDPANAGLGTPVEVPALSDAVLDDEGAVWGLDPERNVLVVTDRVQEVSVPTQTRPFALVDAGGSAQLLDGSGPTLRSLESAGSGLGGGSCVGGDIGTGVAVGGSVDQGRTVVMVDSASGTVRMSDIATGRCTSATIEGGAGARYGASVESAGLAYVPVLSTGEVVVIRTADGSPVGRYVVTGVDRPFELTVKEGTVWFNEPNGSRAGVLGPDSIVEQVDKYQEVVVSADGGENPGEGEPDPNAAPTTGSGTGDGTETEPGDGEPGNQPSTGSSDAAGGQSQSVGSNGGADGPVEDVDLSGLVADFTYSKRVVEVGEEVTFADRSQGDPVAWTWEFGDGSFATGPDATHAWGAVGAYRVTLRIEAETGTAAATATIEVIDENTRSRPNADFRYSASRVEVGETVTFTDRSTGNATDLSWDFGDGSVGTGPAVEHAWTRAGTYQVALTATNALGSDTSEPATITVFDRIESPTAVIQAATTTASVNQTVTFTSASTGNPTSIEWTFGDGTSSRGERVSHAWTSPGAYTIRLRVANSAGTSEATARIVVDERVVVPEARIVASSSTAEEGQAIRFTSLSINNPTTLSWDFGDGSPTESGAAVSHTYNRAGRYTVTLRATNSAGTGVATATIIIVADVPAPVAAFGTSPDTITAGTPIQFLDQSTGGTPTSWVWDFGDGTATSTLRNPTHVFEDEGRYTVRLTVSNSGGDDDVTRTIDVRPPAPVPDFTFSPTTPNAGAQVQFTDATTNVTPSTTWSWSFGDGTAASSQRNPSHVFAERGSYNVTLTVTNSGGVTSTTKTVQVNPRRPAANFRFTPASGVTTATPVQFNFTQASGTGEPETYLWNFGDGDTSPEANPVHTYTRAGSFNVTLTVTNPGGTSTSPAQVIRVTVPPPTAAFTVPATPRLAGTPITFTSTSTGGPFTSVTWEWDDGTANGSGNAPSHTFTRAGTYRVRLTVVNGPGGASNTRSVTQDIEVFAPITGADFTFPGTITAGQAFSFTNPTAGATTYRWDFGDGTTSAERAPSKTFAGPNGRDYVVTMTATNPGGGTATVTKTITVRPAAPVASFTMANDGGNGRIRFTSTSTGTPITGYLWDFGDGATSTDANPVHTFDGDEAYTVTLRVTNATGSNTSAGQTVPAEPTADFSISPAIVNVDEEVTLTSTSTGTGLTIEWFWDDDAAAEATGATATVSFPRVGSYDVTIRVGNLWGVVSRTRTIVVLP